MEAENTTKTETLQLENHDLFEVNNHPKEFEEQVTKYKNLTGRYSLQELAILWSVALGFIGAYVACYFLKIDYGTPLHARIMYGVFVFFNIFAAAQTFLSWARLTSKSVVRDYMFFLSISFIGAAIGNSIDYVLWVSEITAFKQSMLTNLIFIFSMLLAFPGIHFLGKVCRAKFSRQPLAYYVVIIATYAMIPLFMNPEILKILGSYGSIGHAEYFEKLGIYKEFFFGVLYSMVGGYLAAVSLFVWRTGEGKLVASARLIALGMVAMSFGCAIYAGLFALVPIEEIPSSSVNLIIAMGYVLVACGVRRTETTMKTLLALDSPRLPPALTLIELFGKSEGLAVYKRLENNIKSTLLALMKSREETQLKQEAIGELEHEIKLRKKTERDLIYAKEKAEEASKAKSEFLAMMSHELKTPLTAIKGYSELLKGDTCESIVSAGKISDVAGQIATNSDSLEAMVNGLLEFSQLESGNFAYKSEVFSLNDILPYIRSISNEHRKSARCSYDEVVPDSNIKLETDKQALQHIITNLLVNAFKFCNATNVTLEIRRSADDILIAVSDGGIGISAEDQEKIFQAFYQVSLGNKRKYRGIGLGLSIVKKMTDGLKGRISVVSELNKGSKFEVILPKVIFKES